MHCMIYYNNIDTSSTQRFVEAVLFIFGFLLGCYIFPLLYGKSKKNIQIQNRIMNLNFLTWYYVDEISHEIISKMWGVKICLETMNIRPTESTIFRIKLIKENYSFVLKF